MREARAGPRRQERRRPAVLLPGDRADGRDHAAGGVGGGGARLGLGPAGRHRRAHLHGTDPEPEGRRPGKRNRFPKPLPEDGED